MALHHNHQCEFNVLIRLHDYVIIHYMLYILFIYKFVARAA